MIKNLEAKSYDKWLKELGMSSLSKKRISEDRIAAVVGFK